jgi:hypothetical protein
MNVYSHWSPICQSGKANSSSVVSPIPDEEFPSSVTHPARLTVNINTDSK